MVSGLAAAGQRRGAPILALPWAIVGVFARAIRVAVVRATESSFRAINDSADYVRLGISIAHGHGFGTSHFAAGGGPTALRPPLWPLTLGGLFTITGDSVTAGRVLGCVLGAVAVVLTGLIAARLWGRTVGLLAAVLAAIYPPLVLSSVSVMSEAMFLPLLLGCVLVLLPRTTLALHPPGRRAAAVAGLLLGLAMLTRPIAAIAVIPLAFLAHARRPGALARVSLLVVAAIVVLIPWEVRTVATMDAPVPLTTQSGYLLAGTYNASAANDKAHPAQWRPANFDPAIAADLREHPNLDEVRTESLLARDATDYLEHHPSYLLDVVARNAQRLLNVVPASDEEQVVHGEYGLSQGYGEASWVSLFPLLALALGGAVTRAARRAPAALWWVPASVILVTLPVQSFSRFRVPAEPFLLALAALALVTYSRSIRRRGTPDDDRFRRRAR